MKNRSNFTVFAAVLIVLITNQNVLSQDHQIVNSQRIISGSFCRNSHDTGLDILNYFEADLQNCDFKISCNDTNYTVVEFQISLVPHENLYEYMEVHVKSSAIPERFRKQILKQTKFVYLENIKALNRNGEEARVKPFGIRIPNSN